MLNASFPSPSLPFRWLGVCVCKCKGGSWTVWAVVASVLSGVVGFLVGSLLCMVWLARLHLGSAKPAVGSPSHLQKIASGTGPKTACLAQMARLRLSCLCWYNLQHKPGRHAQRTLPAPDVLTPTATGALARGLGAVPPPLAPAAISCRATGTARKVKAPYPGERK